MADPDISKQFKITPEEYQEFCLFLERTTGIVLGTDKLYLVYSRLYNIMTENKIPTITMLIENMKQLGKNFLKDLVIQAMATNETSWFRDIHPYNILEEKILPQYKNKKQLRIWSNACATGQEPYTISICVSEYAAKIADPLFGYIVKIVGTDISSSVLAKAKIGEYSTIEIERGLSEERRQRFFEYVHNGKYKLKSAELSRVVFYPFNLLSDFSHFGKFDVIFCRNVLIYFSLDMKLNIINKFADVLNKDGYLFLGSAEAMPQQCHRFKVINCQPGIIYQLL